MPLTYRIDPLEGLVTIAGDYADAASWQALLAAIARDPAFRPGLCFLRDLRSSHNPVSVPMVVAIIAVVKEFWTPLGVRRAAIVTGPGTDAPAMVAHALADDNDLQLRAFTQYDEAVQWLREGE